jgi:hypothetical protein
VPGISSCGFRDGILFDKTQTQMRGDIIPGDRDGIRRNSEEKVTKDIRY